MSSKTNGGNLALCISLSALSALAVSLRFCTRKLQRLPWLADDWTALLGVISYLGTSVVVLLHLYQKRLVYTSSDAAAGQGPGEVKPAAQLTYAFDFLNTTTLALIKISALLFYRRIFQAGVYNLDYCNVLIVVLMLIVVSWYITFQFLAAFQCPGHFDADWTGGSIKYCSLNYTWNMGLTISNFLLDIIVLLFPIPPVLKLNASTARKLSILGVFSLGFVGLGASIARLIVYVENFHGDPHLFTNSDVYLTEIELVYIQMLESGISITAINLPSLWHLCTITVPTQVSRGMRRLCGRRGEPNGADFTASETSVTVSPPIVSVPEKAAGAPWWSRWSDRAYHSDREGQDCGAMRQLSGEMLLHDLNSIRVQKDIEIRHE